MKEGDTTATPSPFPVAAGEDLAPSAMSYVGWGKGGGTACGFRRHYGEWRQKPPWPLPPIALGEGEANWGREMGSSCTEIGACGR